MDYIGKKYNCGKCQTEVTITSEGPTFICPNCKTRNAIPGAVDKADAAATIIRLIVALALIGVALWALFK